MREAQNEGPKYGLREHGRAARIAGRADKGQFLTATLFFFAPITAILAGSVAIGEFSIHAYTTVAMALIALVGIINQKNRRPKIAIILIALTGSWFTVSVLHIVFGNSNLTSEVTISAAGMAVIVGLALARSSPTIYRAFFNGWAVAYLIAVGFALAENYLGFTASNNSLVNQGYLAVDIGLASLFGNPNAFAHFLLASAIVFYPLSITGKSRLARNLFRFLQLSTAYFMLQTSSRTGIILLAIVLTFSIWNYLEKFRLLRFFVTTSTLFLLTALAVVQATSNRVNSFGIAGGGGELLGDESVEIRWNLHVNGLTFLATNPLIGIGPDGFELYMLSGFGALDTAGIINPHGGMIEVISQYGILVFALYFSLLLTILRSAIARLHQRRSFVLSDRARSQAQLLLIILIPITSTMHSTYLGDPAGWLWLAAIVAFEYSHCDREQRRDNGLRELSSQTDKGVEEVRR